MGNKTKKNQNVQAKMIMKMVAIMKHSQLKKINQNQQYIIHKFRVNY